MHASLLKTQVKQSEAVQGESVPDGVAHSSHWGYLVICGSLHGYQGLEDHREVTDTTEKTRYKEINV